MKKKGKDCINSRSEVTNENEMEIYMHKRISEQEAQEITTDE